MADTANVIEFMRLTRDLENLIHQGKDESPEAEAIRDTSDSVWAMLSEADKKQIREYAYSLALKSAVKGQS